MASTTPLLREEPEWPKPDLNKITKDSKGLSAAEAEENLKTFGKNEIPEHKESLLWMYIKQFTGTMPMMIEIAAILSALNQSWPDFFIICALLFTNGTLGFLEERAAQASVDALKNNLENKVNVIRDGQTTEMPVTELVPGDVLFLKGGNVIPADCYFGDGDELQVDQAALTGESLPVTVPREDDEGAPGDGKYSEGKLLLSGAILKQGECYCVVHKTGIFTLMGEAATSIQDSGGKQTGLFEGKIIQAARVLILITIVVVFILAYKYMFLDGKPFASVLESSLSLVIASVPVALPMVMKVTLSIGAAEMANEGGIVTHLTALEEIASMRVLCSDKTGTLTLGRMNIKYDSMKGYSGYENKTDELIKLGGCASNSSNLDDPIDNSVFKALNKTFGVTDDKDAKKQMAAKKLAETYTQVHYVGFNPTVKRTVAYVSYKEGGYEKFLVVAKGIVNRILKTNESDEGVQWTVVDYENMSKTVADDDKAFANAGYKTVGVAVSDGGVLTVNASGKKVLTVKDGTMKFIGLLPIQDPPRHDTPQTIENIRNKHVYVKMCTGDHLNIAKEVGRQIGLGSNIMPNTELHTSSAQKEDKVLEADGFAQVLPMDKTEVVAILQNKGMVVGMTGDGVNDAPALAKAQIGIAVEGATEAAKSAADIVLTKEGLSAIDVAVNISRRIFKRLKSYVIYRICITVQVVFFLTAIAFISGNTFKALYIILLALLHDLQIVTIAYDLQVEGPKPETPTVMGLLLVSYTMGLTMCLQTVLMYYHGQQFLGPAFSVPGSPYKDAAMFLQISNSSAILIFSARSVKWWFSTKPAWQIMFSAAIGQVLVISIMRFPSKALSSYIHQILLVDIGYILAYDLVWLFILDIVKQAMMHLWDSYEEAHADPDPLEKMNKKSKNSLEPNVPGRKASFKRPSQAGAQKKAVVINK